jgi:hypothetical protein
VRVLHSEPAGQITGVRATKNDNGRVLSTDGLLERGDEKGSISKT